LSITQTSMEMATKLLTTGKPSALMFVPGKRDKKRTTSPAQATVNPVREGVEVEASEVVVVATVVEVVEATEVDAEEETAVSPVVNLATCLASAPRAAVAEEEAEEAMAVAAGAEEETVTHAVSPVTCLVNALREEEEEEVEEDTEKPYLRKVTSCVNHKSNMRFLCFVVFIRCYIGKVICMHQYNKIESA
jgi:type IV secretory pathway VirJ component